MNCAPKKVVFPHRGFKKKEFRGKNSSRPIVKKILEVKNVLETCPSRKFCFRVVHFKQNLNMILVDIEGKWNFWKHFFIDISFLCLKVISDIENITATRINNYLQENNEYRSRHKIKIINVFYLNFLVLVIYFSFYCKDKRWMS